MDFVMGVLRSVWVGRGCVRGEDMGIWGAEEGRCGDGGVFTGGEAEGASRLTAGTKGVDVDFMFCVVDRDSAGEIHDGAFGGAVGSLDQAWISSESQVLLFPLAAASVTGGVNN